MSTVQRAVALGTAVTLTAGITILGASAAHAEESTLPGIDLPVPATDVTDTDTNLGSVAREVVVVVDGPDGKPEVRKLKARTQAEAEELATELNAEPGVAASLNRPVEVPTVPSDAGASSKAERSFELTPKASPKSVLAGEPAGSYQWGLHAVNAEGAWSVTRGSGVIVAVVDTGVDTGHPDLVGQVLTQIDLVGDGATGDPVGHGTHVAGIVAAALDGDGTTGLANQVKVLPVRVLGENGGDDSTVANGIITSVNAGAKVINLSLGSEEDSPATHSAVQYALDSGVTVVAAAGNEYEEGNPVEYPVAQRGVIGVASIGAQFNSSAFSNAGSYVDVSAPGEDILSTVPGGWDSFDGTSMAAPFVAATAALVRVANPTLTKAQVDDVLLSTALDDERRRVGSVLRPRARTSRQGHDEGRASPRRDPRHRRRRSPEGQRQGEGDQREVQAQGRREPEQGLAATGPSRCRSRTPTGPGSR